MRAARCVLVIVMVHWAAADKTCHPCQPGTLCLNESLTSCPLHMSSPPMSSTLADCACKAGFARAGAAACGPCGSSFYCPGADQRLPCPPWSQALTEYAINSSQCACLAGFEGEACEACAGGKVKAVPGPGACEACDSGKYSFGLAASLCEDCPFGTTSPPGARRRTECRPIPGFQAKRTGRKLRVVSLTLGFPQIAPETFDTTKRGRLKQFIAGVAEVEVGKVAITAIGRRGVGVGRRLLQEAGGTAVETEVQSESFEPAAFSGSFDNDTAVVDGSREELRDEEVVVVCDRGEYHSNDTCVDCSLGATPVATYSLVEGSTSPDDCLTCPPHSHINGSRSGASLTDCLCQPGYAGPPGGPCQSCDAGSFAADLGQAACEPCPAGSAQPATGASACVACALGETSEAGAAACVCAPGFFSDDSSPCEPCAPGSFQASPAGTTCEACPAGTVQPAGGASACVACPPNAEADVTRTACVCLGGFQNLSGACVACGPGFYGQAGVCLACPNNTFNVASNASACEACPADSSSPPGSFAAEACACDPGFTPNGLACDPCDLGAYEAGGVCELCPAGTYGDALAMTGCIQCPDNTISTDGATNVDACLCKTGYEVTDAMICGPCPAGTYNPDLHGACQDCAAGSFTATDGSDTCSPCPEGQYQAQAGQVSCAACPANETTTDLGQAYCACEAGLYRELGACVPCLFGSYKPAVGDGSCTPCAPSHVTDFRGAVSADACRPCSDDTFPVDSENGTQCHPCPLNSVTVGVVETATDCYCDKGYQVLVTGELPVCAACTFGTYKSWIGNEPCIDCAPGQTGSATVSLRLNQSSACKDCPDDTYEDGGVCHPCPPNSTSTAGSAGADQCVCVAGFEEAGGVCVPCSAGSFSPVSGSACTLCPYNTHQSLDGQTLCVGCPPNSESEPGSTSQAQCFCMRGYISDGNRSCLPCQPGSFEVDGVCRECLSNTYYSEGPTPYKDDQCIACPDNSTSPQGTYAVTGCQCLSGFVRSALKVCALCPRNHYCPHQYSQKACPTHSASPPGSVSVGSCLCYSGFYGVGSGNNFTCLPCPVNSFCSQGGIEACPVNSTTHGLTGAVNMSACVCKPGTYQGSEDHFECLLCAADAYCPSGNLLSCPHNSSAVSGSDSLANCRCDAYFRKDSNQECELCPNDVLCRGGVHDPVACAPSALVTGMACLCPSGSFCPLNPITCEEPLSCAICPADHYCSANGKLPCMGNASSPPNSFSLEQCVCRDGWYHDSVLTCAGCPLNSYCHGGARYLCVDWDLPLITPTRFATDRDTCICPAGQFRLDSGDTCKPCPKNYYCPSESEISLPNVVACFENEYTLGEGSATRSQCICDAGHKSTSGDTVKCLPCAEGERCISGEVAENCGGDRFRTPNAAHTKCVCIGGYYEDAYGSCAPCPLGTIKPGSGDEACVPCPANTYRYNYSTCIPCPNGTESASSSTTCMCSAPQVGTMGSCELCPANQYYTGDPTEPECRSCIANSTSPRGSAGNASCTCVPGMYLDDSQCALCPAGSYEAGGVCRACPETRTSPPGSTTETDCVCRVSDCAEDVWRMGYCIGSCEEWSLTCQACPAGSFHNLDAALCEPCAVGFFQEDVATIACQQCPATTTTLHAGSVTSAACVCDRARSPDGPACAPCAPGTHKPDKGNHSCVPCEQDTYATTDGLECRPCPGPTSYLNASATVDAGSTEAECTCTEGHTLEASSCVPCPAGSFKVNVGEHACTFCGSANTTYSQNIYHSYSEEVGANKSTTCQECPTNAGADEYLVGPEAPMDSVDACLCFGGYELVGSDVSGGCIGCVNYTVRVGFGVDNCTVCDANHYYVSSFEACEPCVLSGVDSEEHVAVYNSEYPAANWGRNQQECTCRVGFQLVSSRCERCPAGSFRDSLAASQCAPCPANTFAGEGAVTCDQCPRHSTSSGGSRTLNDCLCVPGFVWNGTACEACAPGTFKAEADEVGARGVCEQCASGSYSPVFGASECVACGPHTESSLPRNALWQCFCREGFGASAGLCEICLYGYYSNTTHLMNASTPGAVLVECVACPPNMSTLNHASTSLADCACVPGHGKDPAALLAACAPCASGLYAPGFAVEPCTSCGAHTVTLPAVGATDFSQCQCDSGRGFKQ